MLCRCSCPTKVPPTASQMPPSDPRATMWSRQVCYLVVGANVQQDREALLRVDPSTRGVQGQLAHGDAHAIAAQVSQAQDALPISHHHGLKNRAGCHQSRTAPPVTGPVSTSVARQADTWMPTASAGEWNCLSGMTQPEDSFSCRWPGLFPPLRFLAGWRESPLR